MENKENTRNPQISIIVPVYKVEPYLRQCIDSILGQTFKDFELILVDDGSPDNCGAICDEYAARDDRITVIHKKNEGVSVARNTAMDWVFENSQSQWITFVDSDDLISPNYLEVLHRYGVETDADVVTTFGFDFSAESELENAPEMVASSADYSGRECCKLFFTESEIVMPYPWGRLCKRSAVGSLRFPKGIAFAEDQEFVLKLLYSSGKVTVLRSWLYRYRLREVSASHGKFSISRYEKIKVLDNCIRYFREHGDAELVKLAEGSKAFTLSEYMLLAHGAKMADQVPPEYRMPLLKAAAITLKTTLSNGGLRFVRERIGNFFRLTK